MTRPSLRPFRHLRPVAQWRWQQFAIGFNVDVEARECVIGLGPLVVGVKW